jgi:hypothetical protein
VAQIASTRNFKLIYFNIYLLTLPYFVLSQYIFFNIMEYNKSSLNVVSLLRSYCFYTKAPHCVGLTRFSGVHSYVEFLVENPEEGRENKDDVTAPRIYAFKRVTPIFSL